MLVYPFNRCEIESFTVSCAFEKGTGAKHISKLTMRSVYKPVVQQVRDNAQRCVH